MDNEQSKLLVGKWKNTVELIENYIVRKELRKIILATTAEYSSFSEGDFPDGDFSEGVEIISNELSEKTHNSKIAVITASILKDIIDIGLLPILLMAYKRFQFLGPSPSKVVAVGLCCEILELESERYLRMLMNEGYKTQEAEELLDLIFLSLKDFYDFEPHIEYEHEGGSYD